MTARRPTREVEFPPGEEWMEMFPPYERYLISSEGRIYSPFSRKIMSQYVSFRGRRRSGRHATVTAVVRNARGKPRAISVAHQLLLAFEGLPETDDVVGYHDENRLNVRWANLCWVPRVAVQWESAEAMRAHMAAIAPKGFAASPVAQAHAGNVGNFR